MKTKAIAQMSAAPIITANGPKIAEMRAMTVTPEKLQML